VHFSVRSTTSWLIAACAAGDVAIAENDAWSCATVSSVIMEPGFSASPTA
jgi:hypothetical protein